VVAPFASPPDTTTKIFDASSGKLVHEFTLEDVSYRWVTVAFSGDSRWLATSTANELRLWETDSWRPGSQRARVGSVWPGLVAFNHDGSMLAYSGAPQRIELIEPTTGRTLAKITPPMGWSAGYMEFSPDGTRLAAGAQDHALVIFDLRHIRESLAQMDLDWDPPLPPSTTSPGQRLQVSLELAGVDETELTAPDQLRPTGK
jgi:WD40 repeat protein